MNPTLWFPSEVKPIHVGYCEVRYSGEKEDDRDNEFLFWSGDRWQYTSTVDGSPLWGQSGDGSEFWQGLSGRAQ